MYYSSRIIAILTEGEILKTPEGYEEVDYGEITLYVDGNVEYKNGGLRSLTDEEALQKIETGTSYFDLEDL